MRRTASPLRRGGKYSALVDAAQLHGREDLRIEEVADPDPGPGEVKIAIAHNGLCGSDLHEYFDGPMACTNEPHPLTGGVLPQIMGHEFAGTVAAVGDGVDSVVAGDRVAVEPLYYCRQCDACRAGLTQLCDLVTTHGICSKGGGLAQYTVVPSWMLHRLPETMTLAAGALVEPLAVAFNGVQRGGHRARPDRSRPGRRTDRLRGRARPARSSASTTSSSSSPCRRAVARSRRLASNTSLTPLVSTSPPRSAAETAATVSTPPWTAPARPPRSRLHRLYCARAAATSSSPSASSRCRSRRGSWLEPKWSSRARAVITPRCSPASIELLDGGAYPTDGWVEHVGLDEVTRVLEDLRAGRRVKVLVDLR